ncbi:hypothetical protein Tco_0946637 [Tanacetum coccineum]
MKNTPWRLETLRSSSREEVDSLDNLRMTKRRSKEAGMTRTKKVIENVFKCGDPNHLIGECPKPPKEKNQRTFVKGSWSDSGREDDEKAKDETCLVAQASNEICLGVDLKPDEWIKDSGCSKHMMGNRHLFSSYKAFNEAYADADHAGCQDTRRSTFGCMQLLGDNLVSWSSERHKSAAISSTEAEYISIFHFIKEQVENGVVELYFVNTEYQLADIFTKALCRERIEFLINKLGMRSFMPETLKQLADEAEE